MSYAHQSRLLERREHVRAKGYALSRDMDPASRWSLLLSFKEKPSSRFRHRKITRTQNRKDAQGKGAACAPLRGMGPASRWSLLLSFKEKPSSRFRHRKITRTQNRKTAQGKGAARAPLRDIKVLCFFLSRKKGKKEGQKRRTVLLDGPLFWFTASQSHAGGRLPRTGRRRCTFGGPPWPGRSPR